MRVIDEEQMRLCIVAEITLGDVLPVASIIDKSDGVIVEHAQESRRTAAMLDVRLTLGIDGGEEAAHLRLDEGLTVRCDLRVPASLFLHELIRRARSLARLHGLDGRREGPIAREGLRRIHDRVRKGRAALRGLTTGKSMSV